MQCFLVTCTLWRKDGCERVAARALLQGWAIRFFGGGEGSVADCVFVELRVQVLSRSLRG